jgi:hypothetical protein
MMPLARDMMQCAAYLQLQEDTEEAAAKLSGISNFAMNQQCADDVAEDRGDHEREHDGPQPDEIHPHLDGVLRQLNCADQLASQCRCTYVVNIVHSHTAWNYWWSVHSIRIIIPNCNVDVDRYMGEHPRIHKACIPTASTAVLPD